ncbi:MAG: tyrosine--tRNA ligase [Candidatus Nanoarchaeia archaeon]
MDVDKKIEVIKSFAEEIVTEQELRQLFDKKKHPIAYDGFEPSGKIHIAQGLLRALNVNKLTSAGIKFRFYVADWFAMINNKLGGDLEKIRLVGDYFIEVWKACGMDLDNVEFIWASDFIKEHPEYWETVLKLSMNATVQRVLRCGQIMGRDDKEGNLSSQIIYPLMQAADIYHLGVDIAQLGLDQRKVNMLARDVFPKLGYKPPIAVHHPMLLGLQFNDTDKKGVDRKIALKMSKSKPETAIFMTDSEEEVIKKFKKAYCPAQQEQDNPVLDYAKQIIFKKFDKIVVKRAEKYGGNLEISSYDELKKKYISGDIHPLDLKQVIAEYINLALKPVREHFKKNKKAKHLLEKVSKL